MNNQTLPRKLIEAQQRAAEERGEVIPKPNTLTEANRLDIAAALEDVEVGVALRELAEQNSVQGAANRQLKLEASAANALLKYFQQLGYFKVPEPPQFPPIQQRGVITFHRMDALFGQARFNAWEWLSHQVGSHKEKGMLPKCNNDYRGDVVYWWEDIENRNKFLEFAGMVAHRVQEKYGEVPVIHVTASIEAIF